MTWRLSELEIPDDVPLPFDVSEDVDIKPLLDRWRVLVEHPPESCCPITGLYVFSQKVPKPPSIFGSFARVVFQEQIEADPEKWKTMGQGLTAHPEASGMDPEKAAYLGAAILAFLKEPAISRRYVAELVESHMASHTVQEVAGEAQG